MLRLLAVCLALSLSGAFHFAIDVLLEGDAAAAHFREQDDEQECPPGCADCHCVHGAAALPPDVTAFEAELLPAFTVTWSPHPAQSVPAVELSSVYRPPRA